LDGYFARASVLLTKRANVVDAIEAITVVATAMHGAVVKLPFRLEQRVNELVVSSIRGYIERDLGAVQADTAAALDELTDTSMDVASGEAAVEKICVAIAAFLENLQPLLDPKWTVERDVLALLRQIANKLAGLFVGVSARALQCVGQPVSLARAAVLVLLERRGVPMAKEGLASLAALVKAHPTTIDPHFRANELVSVLHGAADTLLQSYARSRASHISRLMTRSIEAGSWLGAESSSARKPRMVVSVIVGELQRYVLSHLFWFVLLFNPVCDSVHETVGRLFGIDSDRGNLTASVAVSRKPSSYFRPGAANDEMARMFNEKVRVYDRVDFSASSVVALLVRVMLKSWSEALRTRVLSMNALHQMQLDAHSFRAQITPFLSVDQLRVSDLLLAQVEASAEDRCLEPLPLNAAVVQQILSAATQ
jgi:hypothetical protein